MISHLFKTFEFLSHSECGYEIFRLDDPFYGHAIIRLPLFDSLAESGFCINELLARIRMQYINND